MRSQSPLTPERPGHSRQPSGKQVSFTDNDSSHSSSRQGSPSHSPSPAESAKKRRQTPGGKFNALFRRNTASKGGAAGDGGAGARKAYMRNAAGDAAYSGGKGGAGVRLGGLAAFESGGFDLDADLATLTEKGIDLLRGELAALDAECAEELRKSVHSHYQSFIAASQGVGQLDSEMSALRGLLTSSTGLVAALKEVAAPAPATASGAAPKQDVAAAAAAASDWTQTTEGLRWADALDEVDVTIAERRPLDALNALRRVEKAIVRPPPPSADPLNAERIAYELRAEAQQAQLEERQRRLGDVAESALTEVASLHLPAGEDGSSELRMATGVLASVTGSPYAAQKLLAAHSGRLRRAQQQLLKPQNTGGSDADGTEYVGALSQRVFQTIAAAANDMAAVFADDTPELTSLLVVWALQETRRCALLVKRHALSPFAAPAGLASTVHCCCLAAAHCRRLQASHALALAPTLLRELWPACDQVLQRRLRRVAEDVRVSVGEDIDEIAAHGLPETLEDGWVRLAAALPSADVLLDELQAIVGNLAPLAGPKVAEAVRQAISELYAVWARALSGGFSKYTTPDGSLPPRLAPATEPAMETAACLVEQFLPELAAPLAGCCGEVVDSGELMRCIDALAGDLGMQRAQPPEE